ncbi:hypothetical protein MDA_GLEAN10020858 [Myotis davidii]|uniref:Uncharacterized protein n=1 Tax=Myotis davidii TaxID=225400 RepID=L5M255_MYODS|nr:hypothetical protein MDA_GLEAN10020858 [Myotis davidii]
MLHGRSEKVWITQLLSQEWRGVGIPPQRPEIHQLQTPNDLQPPSPRVPALWQPLRDMSLGTRQDSWDKMGTEQTPQCCPPWNETSTRYGGSPLYPTVLDRLPHLV